MPVTCNEILSFAKDCIAREDEVGYRNAISRAYYAAYHSVYPVLDHGPKDNHQGLIDYLSGDAWRGGEVYDKITLKALGYMLQSLKDSRVIADYRLDVDEGVTKRNADESIELCIRVHDVIQRMVSKKVATI